MPKPGRSRISDAQWPPAESSYVRLHDWYSVDENRRTWKHYTKTKGLSVEKAIDKIPYLKDDLRVTRQRMSQYLDQLQTRGMRAQQADSTTSGTQSSLEAGMRQGSSVDASPYYGDTVASSRWSQNASSAHDPWSRAAQQGACEGGSSTTDTEYQGPDTPVFYSQQPGPGAGYPWI